MWNCYLILEVIKFVEENLIMFEDLKIFVDVLKIFEGILSIFMF